ncbi:MAG: DNA mismatch repair protein MutS [Chromatiales bacterium]|jgi:DNA-nicking Smr family endonuclease|nr:DNA mismatch repair protein MutS [Chromatiales bacterium]
MGKKESKHNNSDDGALFRKAAGDVRPLNSPDRHPLQSRKAGSRAAVRPGARNTPDDTPATESIEAGEELSFVRGSLKRSMLRDLRRGKLRIREELDLHGLTGAEAKSILDEFVTECIARNLECVRIVHGKGLRSGSRGPVLKALVNDYLRAHAEVRAFCSARQSDGGTGAVNVLLKTT